MRIQRRPKTTWPMGRTVGVIFVAWFLISFIPIVIAGFGFNFLPSTSWVDSTSSFANIFGGLSACLLTWVFWRTRKVAAKGSLKMVALLIGAPAVGYLLGRNLVMYSIPIMSAVLVGGTVDLRFTIAAIDQPGTKRCRTPVELQGMPLLFPKLCRVPQEFRQKLAPGDEIVVSGRGTSQGLFVENIRR